MLRSKNGKYTPISPSGDNIKKPNNNNKTSRSGLVVSTILSVLLLMSLVATAALGSMGTSQTAWAGSLPGVGAQLTVEAVDLSGNPISGVWTVIRLASDGTVVGTGFTPFAFFGEAGLEYRVSVANYDGRIFQHWDDASTSNTRLLILPTVDTTITATFDTGDSLRGFTQLTYTGTEEQPDLTVKAIFLGGSPTLQMWTIIDPQSSDASGTTYDVYASNYQNRVFDHWENGNTNRVRTLTINEATTITAYYSAEPQNVKVEFLYEDCGLSSAGCGVGTITCADGTTEGPGPISLAFGLTVNRSSDVVQGSWAAVVPGAAGPSGASGNLDVLSFNGRDFETQGDLTFGGICIGDPTDNVAVTFSGVCGGTEINYEATNGTKATIEGRTTCTIV